MDVNVCVLVSCYFIAVFTTAECVVFEINDYDLNRVVLVRESDIVMTCSAPEFNNPQFNISHQSNIIIDSQDNFRITTFTLNKSIEVRITEVQEFHGGIYQCLVAGDGSMTLTNLTLDVRSGNSLSCPQSSETLNVNEGNSLSLFCYFLWSADAGNFTSFDFIWQEKSEPNPVPLNNSKVTPSSDFVKGIVIAVVGPFTADDDDTVYECSHLMPDIAGSLPCSVGPVNVTPRPTNPTSQTSTQQPVTVPATSTPIRVSTKASAPSTTTTNRKTLNVTIEPGENTPTSSSPPSSSSSISSTSSLVGQDIVTEESMTTTSVPENSSITIIILSCVAVIILVIFIAILLCLVFLCKGKSKKRDKEKSDLEMTRHPASHSNHGYLEPQTVTGSSSGNDRSTTGSSSMRSHVYENDKKEQLQANEYQLSDSEDQYNDVSHGNAQSKVGRDYDESAKSSNDAMMLYGKVNKPRKDDSDEESDEDLDVGYDPRKSGVNVLPLYGVVNKSRSLARSKELDEADAGLY
ncbi:hypothetical protein BSL78_10447 [Apostichopus japonicus]|uniref:Ig-like domain-containing protein n=1 Tax=Stichopus japonicus TaxID=307972 RepID=A0A2G8KXN7_STIJA|nr:hypothetical protein BSL78_10447 [Apostichopus japonicus]